MLTLKENLLCFAVGTSVATGEQKEERVHNASSDFCNTGRSRWFALGHLGAKREKYTDETTECQIGF